jgi:allantoinase
VGGYDLLIRGGTIVTHIEAIRADIGVAGENIVAIEPELSGSGRETIDAAGLLVFPGLIDSHVHFNEPGRAHWEGIETGSKALAAGGGTLFFDMPLNSRPPTTDGGSFDQKVALASRQSLVDFSLWGGLVPGNLDRLDEISARGVIGFKAFMSNSGIEDFPNVDDRTLREGMKRVAQFDGLVAVHAESDEMTRRGTEERLSQNRTSCRDYLDSRPIPAELDAIERSIEMAGETGCRLHIVHVSCGAGVALVAAARRKGVDVSCETCPHYLALTEVDMMNLGAVAKCAPPLRPDSAQEGLWACVKSEEIATIGSDHSPSPWEMKTDSNFFRVWGGVSGVQHSLPLLLTEGCGKRAVPLAILARLTSFNVSRRFRLPPTKGQIAPGFDADLALVDSGATFEVRREDLLYRHRHSPYLGRLLTGRVVHTILRGQTVFKNGKIVSRPIGRLVKPLKSGE